MAGAIASGRQLETCLKKDHYPRPEETVESGTICDRCICDTSVVSKVICSSVYPGYILGAIDRNSGYIFYIYTAHLLWKRPLSVIHPRCVHGVLVKDM